MAAEVTDYWLPVKDNCNRGTKMEERDKRKNKGRMKPVTVRRVLPLNYCGSKNQSGQGSNYSGVSYNERRYNE
jgi:hypothetical protein